MRTAVLGFIPLVIVACLAGCGKDRSVGAATTGANAEGLSATLLLTRVDDRWLEGRIRLENSGASAISFRNSSVSDHVTGFRLEAAGQPGFGAKAGLWAKSGAFKLRELAPGMSEEFEIRWKFEVPPKPAKDYPWKVTITNLYVGERKAGDVVLTRPVAVDSGR